MQSFKHIGIQPAVKNKFHSCMNIRRYGEKLFHKQRGVWGMNRDNVGSYPVQGSHIHINRHDSFGECSFGCELIDQSDILN